MAQKRHIAEDPALVHREIDIVLVPAERIEPARMVSERRRLPEVARRPVVVQDHLLVQFVVHVHCITSRTMPSPAASRSTSWRVL